MALVVKNPLASAGDIRDTGSIPGLGRSPGGGRGNPLQYSCLKSPMDRGTWRAAVRRVTRSQTRLKQLSTHVHVGSSLQHTGFPLVEVRELSCPLVLPFTFQCSFPGGSAVKNLPASVGDVGSIPGLGRSPGEGNGNPLQYSCLKNPMGRGAWWATVHGVAKELDTTS